MYHRLTSPSFWLGFALTLLLWNLQDLWSAPPPYYMVQPLGLAHPGVARNHPGPTAQSIIVDALDDDNTVIGTYGVSNPPEAAIIWPTPQLLGRLTPGTISAPQAIHQGEVVGYAFDAQDNNHAFRATIAVRLQDLGLTVRFSIAQAVHHGVKAGYCAPFNTTGFKPCTYTDDGVAHPFATLGGPTGSIEVVSAQNLLGGASQIASGPTHATLWFLAMPTAPLDFHPPGASSSTVTGINAANVVTIQSTIPGQGPQAWQWSAAQGFEHLVPLPGQQTSFVVGLNSEGIKIGQSRSPSMGGLDPGTSVRWVGTTPQALTPLVANGPWDVYNTVAINEAGVILAYATFNGQYDYAVLLIPVEPYAAFFAPPGPIQPK